MNFNSNFFMPRRAHAPINTMAGAKRSGTQAKGERETRTRAERVWRLPTGMASCGDEALWCDEGAAP